MADPTFPLAPMVAAIALIMTITPLGYISFRDHIGIMILILWQSTNCIQIMVNRILWYGTTDDLAPLWCDIVAEIGFGRNVGIPASGLLIIRGVYRVVQMDNHFDGDAKNRQMLWQSFAIGIFLPGVVMGFYPLVAVHRYVITEDVGCVGWLHNDWPTFGVVIIWQLIIGVKKTLVYGVLTLHKCSKMKRSRRVFSDQSEPSHFLFSRTMVCAWVLSVALLPICAYNIIFILHSGLEPYPGLVEITKLRKVVIVHPHSHSPPKWWSIHVTYVTTAFQLLPSFTFFLIFGTGEMAIRYYSRIFSRVATSLGFTSKLSGAGMLPETVDIEMAFAARSGGMADSTVTPGEGIVEINSWSPLGVNFPRVP